MKKILMVAALAIFAMSAASAQDKGSWAIGPKISAYTNTGANGAILGIGAMGRYSFTDNLRIEPSILALCHDDCSIDVGADMQYLFNIAPSWYLYPEAGVSANDIGDWSCGIHIGGGADFSLTHNLDLTADAKWMIQTATGFKNPFVISVGVSYKF